MYCGVFLVGWFDFGFILVLWIFCFEGFGGFWLGFFLREGP